MSTSTITIRIDEELKKRAELLFNEMGMNITTAFTIFAKAVVRQHKIPFEISADSFFNEQNMAYLERVTAELSQGKGKEHKLLEI